MPEYYKVNKKWGDFKKGDVLPREGWNATDEQIQEFIEQGFISETDAPVVSTTPPSYPGAPTPETITMTKDDLAALMKKTMADAMKMFEAKQNDPQPILKQRVKGHTAKLPMWDGKFVVGFKNTQRNPDSKPQYFNDEFNPDRKRIEEYVTLIFDDGAEEKVCFLDFMNKMMPIVCKIEKVDVDKYSEEYTAITDPSFSGEEPKEVLLSTNYEKRTYTLLTPEMNLPDGTVLEPKQIEVFEDFVNMK